MAPPDLRTPLRAAHFAGFGLSAALGAGTCYAVVMHSVLLSEVRIGIAALFGLLFAVIHAVVARGPSPASAAFTASASAIVFGGPALFFLALLISHAIQHGATVGSLMRGAVVGTLVGSLLGGTCGLIFTIPIAAVVAGVHAGIVALTRAIAR